MPPFLNYQSDFEDSRFVVLPVPMELSVSYGKGTSRGPDAILDASIEVEPYDIEYQGEPIDCGVHTAEPVRPETLDASIFIEEITQRVGEIAQAGKIPLVLGGEHSLSYGVYKGLSTHYKNISVLHFDAHADLRDSYFGSPYSHASVMRRIVSHRKDLHDVVSVGIRSHSKEEAQFIKESGHKIYYAGRSFDASTIKSIVSHLGENLYITLDIDVFDPAVIPSTGTPEPGGLGWYDVIDTLKSAITGRRLIGVDLVEVSPDAVNHHTQFTASKILYKIIGYEQKYGIR